MNVEKRILGFLIVFDIIAMILVQLIPYTFIPVLFGITPTHDIAMTIVFVLTTLLMIVLFYLIISWRNYHVSEDIKQNIKPWLSISRSKFLLALTSFLLYISLVIIGYLTIDIPPFGLGSSYSPIFEKLTYSVVLTGVIILFPVLAPFVILHLVITLRTKSIDYLAQLSSVVLFYVTGLLYLVAFANTPYLPKILVCIWFFIFVFISWIVLMKFNKKPLLTWGYLLEKYQETILTSQALEIIESEDGHSDRPFFQSFNELNKHIKSSKSFTLKLGEYAKFLGKKGELVGWKIDETKVTLFPRFFMRVSESLVQGIKIYFQTYLKILRLDGLTAIKIDYKRKEISLQVSEDDYSILGDTTYHLLGEKIINNFKESVLAFLQEEQDEALKLLYPNSFSQ